MDMTMDARSSCPTEGCVDLANMVRAAPNFPVHLLWEDVPSLMMTDTKKKKKSKKAGWGLSFVAEAGASAEERGVTPIMLRQLPGYPMTDQGAVTPQPAPPDVSTADAASDAADDEPQRQGRLRGRRIALNDDD